MAAIVTGPAAAGFDPDQSGAPPRANSCCSHTLFSTAALERSDRPALLGLPTATVARTEWLQIDPVLPVVY
jgi:hypothetical protein